MPLVLALLSIFGPLLSKLGMALIDRWLNKAAKSTPPAVQAWGASIDHASTESAIHELFDRVDDNLPLIAPVRRGFVRRLRKIALDNVQHIEAGTVPEYNDREIVAFHVESDRLAGEVMKG